VLYCSVSEEAGKPVAVSHITVLSSEECVVSKQ
jgi:hypothetical protein